MVAVGLPARLLLPQNWAELIDNLSLGLAGIEDTELPYDGERRVAAPDAAAGCAAAARARRGARLLARPPTGGSADAGARRAGRDLRDRGHARLAGRGAALGDPAAAARRRVALDAPHLEPRRAAVALAVARVPACWRCRSPRRLETGTPVVGLRELGLVRRATARSPSTGTTPTARSTGRARARRCSRSAAAGRCTGRRACSTASTASPGSARREATRSAAAERFARRRTPGDELVDRHRDWLTQASFEVEALSSDARRSEPGRRRSSRGSAMWTPAPTGRCARPRDPLLQRRRVLDPRLRAAPDRERAARRAGDLSRRADSPPGPGRPAGDRHRSSRPDRPRRPRARAPRPPRRTRGRLRPRAGSRDAALGRSRPGGATPRCAPRPTRGRLPSSPAG